jgi:hypothetical protein
MIPHGIEFDSMSRITRIKALQAYERFLGADVPTIKGTRGATNPIFL